MTAAMLKAAITTLGCKTNQFESAAIGDQLMQRCYAIVDVDEAADLYIINTCTVTNRTDFKSRNLIRKALKRKADNPSTRIIVTGCYAQRNFDEIMAMGEIDLIVDNQAKTDLGLWLDAPSYRFSDIMTQQDFAITRMTTMLGRTRAFLKIQDGCDSYCTYCAVPYARGHDRSCPAQAVLEQAEVLAANGYREIVIGGVNLGLYQDGDTDLAGLLHRMEGIEGLDLIRLSSLEPDTWTEPLIEYLSTSSKACPHVHIPVQSGSDTVLKRMGRYSDTKYIAHLLKCLLEARPDIAIGLDVICGFPAETQVEFEDAFAFLRSFPIAYLHVFPYSKRPGTVAATMLDQVHGSIKKERVERLISLSEQKTDAYRRMIIEHKIPLRGLVEKAINGLCECLSDHYLRIHAEFQGGEESAPTSAVGSLSASNLIHGTVTETAPKMDPVNENDLCLFEPLSLYADGILAKLISVQA